jgi:hypothetical protein
MASDSALRITRSRTTLYGISTSQPLNSAHAVATAAAERERLLEAGRRLRALPEMF